MLLSIKLQKRRREREKNEFFMNKSSVLVVVSHYPRPVWRRQSRPHWWMKRHMSTSWLAGTLNGEKPRMMTTKLKKRVKMKIKWRQWEKKWEVAEQKHGVRERGERIVRKMRNEERCIIYDYFSLLSHRSFITSLHMEMVVYATSKTTQRPMQLVFLFLIYSLSLCTFRYILWSVQKRGGGNDKGSKRTTTTRWMVEQRWDDGKYMEREIHCNWHSILAVAKKCFF